MEFTLPLNKFEKRDLVISLHKKGHAYRNIAHLAHVSVRDIKPILKAYEKKMVKKNLMINESSCMQTQILRYGGNRGRERGQRARLYKRGRGRGCYGSWYRQDQDDSKVTCYRCDKLRHYMSNCPGKLLKFQDM